MKQKVELGKTYDFTIQSISTKEHRMALGFGTTSKPAKARPVKEAAKEEVPAEEKPKE